MATMIPDIDPRDIPNAGEGKVYAALRSLPPNYTICYSLKYRVANPAAHRGADFGEADFVVVAPPIGYIVIEVKQGKIEYRGGQWLEHKPDGPKPLSKDPLEQARKAMFAIADYYRAKAGVDSIPFTMRYALWFPESPGIRGDLPMDLTEGSVLAEPDIDDPARAILRAFGSTTRRADKKAFGTLVDKVLAPTFRVFARLEEEIDSRKKRAERILTEEQQRILDETELDKRKVFLGAAGTGKTFLAIEKGHRLAKSGRRVFLTCFNKNLAAYMRKMLFPQLAEWITCQNFHDYLEYLEPLLARGVRRPENREEVSHFFDETLPEEAYLYFSCEAPDNEKYDSVIVDEGQDFHGNWVDCLQAMLRSEDGEFYVFADPNQDVFDVRQSGLGKLSWSKHRLTRNLRNTEKINDWMVPFVKQGALRPLLTGGLPVVYRAWEDAADEKRLIETEVGRLVSQGLRPERILILSPNTLKHSCLRGCRSLKNWPLAVVEPRDREEDMQDEGGGTRKRKASGGGAIRFATIRSFKGLEADVVFLIGLYKDNHACTEADIYVGGSRARFLLYVFYSKPDPPGVLSCESGVSPGTQGEV
jgi:hypothetical protein